MSGGVSLLVLLTLSMQIVLGGEGLMLAAGGDASVAQRVCLRRMPTEVARVIRDLVERCEPAVERRAPSAWRVASAAPGAELGRVAGSVREAMGEWLLDLPPPPRVV